MKWEDELFAILHAVIETRTLSNAGASFAESLYNLRRRFHGVKNEISSTGSLLTRATRHWAALLVLVSPHVYDA
jgi:Pex2 / Pex12 amino terminal region